MTDEDRTEALARRLCNEEHNTAYIWDGGCMSEDAKDYWRRCASEHVFKAALPSRDDVQER